MANQKSGVVQILDDDEVDVSFLSELDEVEAQALSSLSKRRRITTVKTEPQTRTHTQTRNEEVVKEEGAYMAALKGSKSLTWQSQVTQSQTQTQTLASGGGGGGACFKCGKEGHWARECPQTTSSGMGPTRPTSSLSSPVGPTTTPEKGCPCGMGNCLLLTANTERNRGRKFFRCPLRQESGGCGFFEWCDDSSGNQFSAQEQPWKNGSQGQFYNHPTNQGIAGSTKPWNDYDKGTSFTNSSYGAAQKFESPDNKGYSMRAGSSCFKCGEEGHWARECPAASSNATASVRGKTSSDTCYKCGGSGHWAKDCSQGQNTKLRNR